MARVQKNGCEIMQTVDGKKLQIWKDGRVIRELTAGKKTMKYDELMKVLEYYLAMEDL